MNVVVASKCTGKLEKGDYKPMALDSQFKVLVRDQKICTTALKSTFISCSSMVKISEITNCNH